jgi:hypothetical protein
MREYISTLNWYKYALFQEKFIRNAKSLLKLAFRGGEYWIMDNICVSADGNIDESNHEGYAIAHAQRELMSDLGIYDGDWCLEPIASEIFRQIESSFDDDEEKYEAREQMMSDPELFILDYGKRVGMNEELFFIANGNGADRAATTYAIKNWGWKRVLGNNVETYTLTTSDLEKIINGLWEAYEYDLENENVKFNIEVVSNQAFYRDVPYSVLESKNLLSIRRYRQKPSYA